MTISLTQSLSTDRRFDDSLLETGVQGVIGEDIARIEGPLKVAGAARYTAEYRLDNVAHGFLVLATVAKAKSVRLDDAEARRVPGVIEIFTDAKFLRHTLQPGATKAAPANDGSVIYAGQPLALVVAETYEAARDAGTRIKVAYDEQPADLSFGPHVRDKKTPEEGNAGPAHSEQGNIEAAMRKAAVTLDVTYTTPSQHSAAMEPHAAIAEWQGKNLVVHGSLQMLQTDRKQLAKTLGIKDSQIRLIAPYVGGGFGSKLFISPELVASALAAKTLGRPVKTVMTRQHVFQCTLRRSNTQQRIRMGADANGRLVAIGHDTLASNLPGHDFFEPSGIATHFLYAGENRHIHHDLVRTNWLVSGSMRAPGEGSGMLASECAVDEMAEKLGMDPINFRMVNEPPQDPEKDVPFSSRQLMRCMEVGAERFGWAKRRPAPAQVRDGEWFVGIGMAAAARANKLQPSEARVTLTSKGRAVVETDMTDIGTGTYTILAQITAEMLGLPLDHVEVRLGDTTYPQAFGSGGSIGAGSSGSSVYVACEAIREQLCRTLGCASADLTLKDGSAIADNRKVALADLVGDGITAQGEIKPGANEESHTQASFGAHFAEVAVNAVTGEARVRRMLGVFAAGRILNAKTARSQCIGGMVFGIGAALEEDLVHDARTGRIVNHDLAEYHIPVNADVPSLDVVFLDERDHWSNPLQSKGLGELGIAGAGAAIVNAIYNACGVRVRDYPVTLDKLLAGLPSL